MTNKNNNDVNVFYNDPIFLKAVKNLNDDDIQFFKDLQEGKIDLKNKKDLKKRYKEIQLRMVSNFNFQEIRKFIKVMYYIWLYNKDKVVWNKIIRDKNLSSNNIWDEAN